MVGCAQSAVQREPKPRKRVVSGLRRSPSALTRLIRLLGAVLLEPDSLTAVSGWFWTRSSSAKLKVNLERRSCFLSTFKKKHGGYLCVVQALIVFVIRGDCHICWFDSCLHLGHLLFLLWLVNGSSTRWERRVGSSPVRRGWC